MAVEINVYCYNLLLFIITFHVEGGSTFATVAGMAGSAYTRRVRAETENKYNDDIRFCHL